MNGFGHLMTQVIGPDGEWLVGPAGSGEELLHAELDLDLLDAEFQHFDAVGHYARPDLFTLHVDERPQKPVAFAG